MKEVHTLKTPGKKNPRNLCLAADATIGMAGVLGARLGRTATLCKFFASRSIGGCTVVCIRSLELLSCWRTLSFHALRPPVSAVYHGYYSLCSVNRALRIEPH